MSMRSIAGFAVSPIGLGAAGLSVADHPSEEQAVEVIAAALDAGIRLIDSAACYVPSGEEQGHNEALVAKGLAAWGGDADEVLVATKCGIKRNANVDFATDFVTSGRPEFLREQCETSLAALGVDSIGLYQLHTPPPDTDLVDVMGTLAELQREGKIRHIGLSNVTVEQLDQAHQIVDVVSVQNRFSPPHRENLDVVRACEQRDIAFLAYSPLGGLGARARELGDVSAPFADVAATRGVSVHQVALAWELALSPRLIPIPGVRRVETALDSAAAADLTLTADEIGLLTGPTS
jgi:aryl-alcohol dehydrogenase-like predicted oxidoreductase